MPGTMHCAQESEGARPTTKMRSREGIPNHISLRNIREDMVSILALLRTRAGVEFLCSGNAGAVLQDDCRRDLLHLSY